MKLDLTSTFVVVQPDHSAVPVAVTPTIFEDLDARFDGFKGRLLVSSFTFESDWSTWEIHPAGDEIVCLLSGDVTLVLTIPRDFLEAMVVYLHILHASSRMKGRLGYGKKRYRSGWRSVLLYRAG